MERVREEGSDEENTNDGGINLRTCDSLPLLGTKLGGASSFSIAVDDQLDPFNQTMVRDLDERFSSLQESRRDNRCQKRARESPEHGTMENSMEGIFPEDEHTLPAEETEMSKKVSYNELRQKYAEHCAEVDVDSEFGELKLSWDEFCCQRPISEEEFGPEDNIDTVFSDNLHSKWANKLQEREWRLKVHRFNEVAKMKRRRQEADAKSGTSSEVAEAEVP